MQGANFGYLNSLEATNGLSGLSCNLMAENEVKPSLNLEGIARLIDATDPDFEAEVRNRQAKKFSAQKDFSEKLRTNISEYHMRVALFQTLYQRDHISSPVYMPQGTPTQFSTKFLLLDFNLDEKKLRDIALSP